MDLLKPKENKQQVLGEDVAKKQRWLLYKKLFLENDNSGNHIGEKKSFI